MKEMDKSLRLLLDLYHRSVDKDFEFSLDLENVDFEMIYKISSLNRISNCIYYALISLDKELVKNIPHLDDFRKECIVYGMKEKLQEQEIEDIIRVLNSNDIKIIFFKGYFLKNIYPSKDMRVMGDIDFLIEPQNVNKAVKLIESIGFIKDKNTDFNVELGLKRRFEVELHKKLSVLEYDYFDDAFDHVEKFLDYPNTYVLETNYHFIYLISHAYYHFIHGGLGMKYPMDFYLFLNKYQLDLEKLEKDLKKLKLLNFTRGMLLLINRWFNFDLKDYSTLLGDFKAKDELELLETFIVNGGEYGMSHNVYLAKKASSDNKASFLLSKIFRPFRFVCKTDHPRWYQYLLLPYYYLKHWITYLFINGKRNMKKLKAFFKKADTSDLETMYKKFK